MAMKTNTQLLNQLSSVIKELMHIAQQIDNKNKAHKARHYFEDKSIFDGQLFSCRDHNFLPYVKECHKKYQFLQACVANNQHALVIEIAQQLENQISALKKALAANGVTQNNQANIFTRKKKAPKYQKIAKAILEPAHQLHQKLAEHHEFERRLALMIAEREQLKVTASGPQLQKLNTEILALHQRLGRCRKAISGIEVQIEMAETRSSFR